MFIVGSAVAGTGWWRARNDSRPSYRDRSARLDAILCCPGGTAVSRRATAAARSEAIGHRREGKRYSAAQESPRKTPWCNCPRNDRFPRTRDHE